MKTRQSKNTTNKKQKQRLAFPVYDEEDAASLTGMLPSLRHRRVHPAQYGSSSNIQGTQEEEVNQFLLKIFGKRNRYLDLIEKYGNH